MNMAPFAAQLHNTGIPSATLSWDMSFLTAAAKKTMTRIFGTENELNSPLNGISMFNLIESCFDKGRLGLVPDFEILEGEERTRGKLASERRRQKRLVCCGGKDDIRKGTYRDQAFTEHHHIQSSTKKRTHRIFSPEEKLMRVPC